MTNRDWEQWHTAYEDPASDLSKRLQIVQGFIKRALPSTARPFKILDLCAGNGRDLLEVLGTYEHVETVSTLMIELDTTLASAADRSAITMQLSGVEVIHGDAGNTDLYKSSVPADLVMLCGIFGNIGEVDIERTVRSLPGLCAEEATVIWTRNRREPDLTPAIRALFTETGFVELDFSAPDDVTSKIAVGLNQFTESPQPLQTGQTLFRFQ